MRHRGCRHGNLRFASPVAFGVVVCLVASRRVSAPCFPSGAIAVHKPNDRIPLALPFYLRYADGRYHWKTGRENATTLPEPMASLPDTSSYCRRAASAEICVSAPDVAAARGPWRYARPSAILVDPGHPPPRLRRGALPDRPGLKYHAAMRPLSGFHPRRSRGGGLGPEPILLTSVSQRRESVLPVAALMFDHAATERRCVQSASPSRVARPELVRRAGGRASWLCLRTWLAACGIAHAGSLPTCGGPLPHWRGPRRPGAPRFPRTRGDRHGSVSREIPNACWMGRPI